MTSRRIIRRRAEPGRVAQLPATLHPVLRRVYELRGVGTESDLDLRLERMLPISSLGGVDAAVDLLLSVYRREARVIVVGDFDADGGTAATDLLLFWWDTASGLPVTLGGDGTVTWNDDKGHTGGNKTLDLVRADVGPTTIWTGNVDKQSTYTIPTTAILPPGTTTISFFFHQTYDNPEPTDRIYINLLTPGCENNPIDSK